MKRIAIVVALAVFVLVIVGCVQEPETRVITESMLTKADFLPAKDVKDADFWLLEFEDGTKVSKPYGPYGGDTSHPATSYKIGQIYKVWEYENVANDTSYHIDVVTSNK